MRGFWPIPILLLAAGAYAAWDSDSGIRTWLRLRAELWAAEAGVEEVRLQVAALEDEARALAEDPFALERAIREELGWARPGETVVRNARPEGLSDGSNSRFP